jgi:hypothetical protein
MIGSNFVHRLWGLKNLVRLPAEWDNLVKLGFFAGSFRSFGLKRSWAKDRILFITQHFGSIVSSHNPEKALKDQSFEHLKVCPNIVWTWTYLKSLLGHFCIANKLKMSGSYRCSSSLMKLIGEIVVLGHSVDECGSSHAPNQNTWTRNPPIQWTYPYPKLGGNASNECNHVQRRESHPSISGRVNPHQRDPSNKPSKICHSSLSGTYGFQKGKL